MASPVDDKRYACSFCSKSFGRHEHQKRHELIHTTAKPYRCTSCPKEFIRKDALQRHESTHDSSMPSLLQLGVRACSFCASARVKCSGEPQCRRCQQRNLQCTYPNRVAQITSSASPSSTLQVVGVNFECFAQPDSLGSSNSMQFEPDFWDPAMLASTNWLETIDLDGFDPVIPSYSHSPSDVACARSAAQEPHTNASVENTVPSPALTGTTGTNSETIERTTEAGEYYVDGEPARLPRTKRRKTSAAIPQRQIISGPFSLREPAFFSVASDALLPLDPVAYSCLSAAYRKCCLAYPSLWQTFEPAEFPSKSFFERLLWLYRNGFSQTLPFFHHSSFAGHQAFQWPLVAAMAAIGSHYIESDRKHEFAASMHEFVRRILHLLDENLDLIDDAPGTGHGASIFETQRYHSGQKMDFGFPEQPYCSTLDDEITYPQVLLLHAVGTTYCGSANVSRHAHGLQQKLAARYHRLTQLHQQLAPLTSALDGTPSGEEEYHSWCRRESIVRLIYSIWLLDAMFAYHFQQKSLLSLSDAKVELPCNEKLWLASDISEWNMLRSEQPQLRFISPTLPRALQELYIDKRLPRDRGEFARVLMIHGLFQRSWEVQRYFSDPLSHWEPVAQRESSAEVLPSGSGWLRSTPTFAKWQNTSCDSLDILHWQANATIGQASGLEHPTVLHLHMARIVLLVPYREIVTFAKAHSETSPAFDYREAGRSPEALQICSWAVKHQYKARLAVVHAGVVFWHVRRYATDAFYEAPAVALAALTLWAFGYFAGAQPAESISQSASSAQLDPSSQARQSEASPMQRQVRVAPHEAVDDDTEDSCNIILLDRPTDDELVQHFIRDGHKMQAHLSGVGDLYHPGSPRLVLKQGCKLLSSSGKYWAVAFEWLQLLEHLGRVTGMRARRR